MNTRRADQWSTVDELALIARQAVRPFEPVSCLNALYAVAWSSARELPSLAFLMGQALVGEPTGERAARPADVAAWLQTMRRRVPVVDEIQQAEPLDADLDVHVFWGDRLWPLHPGAIRDPEQLIEQLRRYAAAADPVLMPELGFGIADVVTIGLRVMAIQRAFRPDTRTETPSAAFGEQDQPPPASLIEFFSQLDAEGVPRWLSWSEGVVDGQLLAAVEWCARPARDVASSTWLLDDTLLVRAFDTVLPVPAGLVLEALTVMGAQLLTLAGRTSDAAASNLRDEAETTFVASGRGLATHFVGPVHCVRSGRLTGVMFPAARRLIAVQVAVGTSERETAREANRARRRLAAVKAGSLLTLDVVISDAEHWAMLFDTDSPLTSGEKSGTAVIAESTVIRRVVVVDGPWKAPDKIYPGTVFFTLEEWREIAAGVGDDREEFWAFLDELAELPGLRMIENAAPLDLWDAFRQRGLLFDASMQLHQPGSDFRRQWLSRAARDPYEIVLRRVGLPGLRDWPFTGEPVEGCLTVGQTTPYQHVVICAEPALAFAVDADNAPERGWTNLLGGAILTGLTSLAAATIGDLAAGWQAWAEAVFNPILIRFHAMPPEAEQSVRLVAVDGTTAVLGYRPFASVTVTSLDVHEQVGDALWCLLVGTLSARDHPATSSQIVNADIAAEGSDDIRRAGEAFTRAWAQLPPTATFVKTAGRPATRAVAATISDGARARAQRTIINYTTARTPLNRVLDDPDEFLHNDAVSATVQLLHEQIARFSSAAATRTTAVAVERLRADRIRTDDDRALRRALGLTAQTEVDDLAHVNIVASRAGDLLTEVIVGHCPDAGLPMDHRDWHQLFNITAILVHLLASRDRARAGISSDGQPDPAGRDVPFHGDRYAADVQLTHDTRHGRMLLQESDFESNAPHGPVDGPSSWTDLMHHRIRTLRKSPLHQNAARAALTANDTLGAAYGTGCDEILAILAVAAQWETTSDIAEVRVLDLVQTACRYFDLQPDRLCRAADLLTLHTDIASRITLDGPSAPIGERLAGRPLLSVPGHRDTLILMPRRVARAADLLRGYLDVARLPWPDAPAEVIKAFQDWEQAEQKAFEADIEREANAPRRILVPRLKPARATKWGLTIPGEIDLIVIDIDHRRVFVIEAKAGHVATDIERALYDIIDFHGAPNSGHARWDSFRAPRGTPYLPELAKKASAIKDQLDVLLRAHKVEPETGDWTVVEMVVTPGPVPAAYVPQPQVPFATIGSLSRILDEPATPNPGPHTQGSQG